MPQPHDAGSPTFVLLHGGNGSSADWAGAVRTGAEGQESLLPEMPAVETPEELGIMRVNWRSGERRAQAAVRAAYAGSYLQAAFLALLNSYEPDETAAISRPDARCDAGTWGSVPHTYVRFSADRALPPVLQGRMITEADGLSPHHPLDVVTLDAPHVGPHGPNELAAVLANLL
ncbi:hypothetical protein [Streptomyces chrestomyceticus]|uniref:hypothetical protein n=1 Tax=Streptomyces chrestomyceticus TaxID=68185 RepID=UPI0035A8F7F7